MVKVISQGHEEQASRKHASVLNPITFFYELPKQLKVPGNVDSVTEGAHVFLTLSSSDLHDLQLPLPQIVYMTHGALGRSVQTFQPS